jgi:hypothetical protein
MIGEITGAETPCCPEDVRFVTGRAWWVAVLHAVGRVCVCVYVCLCTCETVSPGTR